MLWIPQKGIVQVQHNVGSVGTTTPGTAVTTSGTSTVKGTAVELIAATDFDAYWISIIASGYGSNGIASQGCLDILIGTATESILIPDLLMGYCGGIGTDNPTRTGPKRWDFPLYIPKGSRLAAQAAGIRLSTAFRVAVWIYGGYGSPAFRVGSRVTTYGISTVPNGTTITPGASGAEGAWVEIEDSTLEDHFAVVPSFQVTGDTTVNFRGLAVDIGIGAATEQQIAEGYLYSTDDTEQMQGPVNSAPTFQSIPIGSRLSLRASNSGTNDGGYNAALHCVS